MQSLANFIGAAILLSLLVATKSQAKESDLELCPEKNALPSNLNPSSTTSYSLIRQGIFFCGLLLLQQPSTQVQPNEILQSNQTIKIERFRFVGNTVFTSKELERVLAPYLAKEVTFVQLLEARSLITKIYTDQGYINSGAFIPITENQNLDRNHADVTIKIIEGRLSEVNITGSRLLKYYTRQRLPGPGSILNSQRLLKALQLLQQDPLIESITSQLVGGSQLGESILNVQVKEKQPIEFDTNIDNLRSPGIGSFERGATLSDANLFGLGDTLKIQYQNTVGSNTESVAYSIPVNPQNGTINLGFTNISASIVQVPFNALDILSNVRDYEVSYRQPVIRQASEKGFQELALGIIGSYLESESSLLSQSYPLSAGADSQGRTRISEIGFFQEWAKRSNNQSIFARSLFDVGVGALGATLNSAPPDSRFFVWQGQGLWEQKLASDGTSIVLKGNIQLADRPLVPLTQFSLGGINSVRGYRQDTYLTDNGVVFSTELHIPAWNQNNQELQVIPFFDFGTAWNNSTSTTSSSGTLASVGLGLQYQINNRLNAQIDWGIPIIPIAKLGNTWQENGIYFTVKYRLF